MSKRNTQVNMPPMYFAYGSNLSVKQMQSRCPSAMFLGSAWLKGHRLAFVGYSRAWGGGVATVERSQQSVAGAVYALTSKDLCRLDVFEGAPSVYQRRKMRVEWDGITINAWTYLHTSNAPRSPSSKYTGTILNGYRRLQLPKHELTTAVERTRKAEEEMWRTELYQPDPEDTYVDEWCVSACSECGALNNDATLWPEHEPGCLLADYRRAVGGLDDE